VEHLNPGAFEPHKRCAISAKVIVQDWHLLTVMTLALSDLSGCGPRTFEVNTLHLLYRTTSNQPTTITSEGASLQPHLDDALRQNIMAVFPRSDSLRGGALGALLRERLCKLQATCPDQDPVYPLRDCVAAQKGAHIEPFGSSTGMPRPPCDPPPPVRWQPRPKLQPRARGPRPVFFRCQGCRDTLKTDQTWGKTGSPAKPIVGWRSLAT
jgi:hypothetical protein